ncbi:hypothetical protein G5V65_17925, partial [Rhodobacter sp. HX-7-19]
RQRHDLYAKYHDYDSEISDLLGECGVLLFVQVPESWRLRGLALLALVLAIIYVYVWLRANKLRSISVKIEGTTVKIKVGDIFEEDDLKVIACNEYFDTIVDDKIIAKNTVNGAFITSYLDIPVSHLDAFIESYRFEENEVGSVNSNRTSGKTQRYRLGTIVRYGDFLLTAFAKFDDSDRATLTMPEYLEFLMNFWDRVNKVYAGKSVSVTVFGSGITRIKGHKLINDEELLKIMLWTFRVSEMRFKHPAILTIVIHGSKIDKIDLFDIASARHGV